MKTWPRLDCWPTPSVTEWSVDSLSINWREKFYHKRKYPDAPVITMTSFTHAWKDVFATLQLLQQPFYGPLSGTTRVSRYHKKHSPTHHPDHHPIFISFFHLLQSIASSLFRLRAWQLLKPCKCSKITNKSSATGLADYGAVRDEN